jgi:hypothetical protein
MNVSSDAVLRKSAPGFHACAAGGEGSSISRHTCRGDPGGRYEKEGQPLDPRFLTKASELTDRSTESAATDARARRTASTDRQAAFDVIEIGAARSVSLDVARDQNVTSKVPAVI